MKKLLVVYLFPLLLFPFLNCEKQEYIIKEVKGCGDFYIHALINNDMMLSVSIDYNKIRFSEKAQTFDNIAKEEFAHIEIEQNCDVSSLWMNACNDVFYIPECQTVKWKLQSGKLEFRVNKVLEMYGCTDTYYATVLLSDATFTEEGSGNVKTFETLHFYDVLVGWCSG